MASALMSTPVIGSRQLAGQSVQCKQWHAAPARRTVTVFAADDDDDRPKFSFRPNQRAARGYQEEDSAGQTNVFAVEPKQYLAGSSRDQPDVNPNTQIIAVSVGAIALALVASGFVKGLTNDGVPISDEPGSYLSLSEYSSKFSGSDVAAAPSISSESQA